MGSAIMTNQIKDHSIVNINLSLRDNHIGEPVSYQGVDGKLIRYIPSSGSLMELTLAEARECLAQNRPEDQTS
jgi:hypothetical protein